MEKEELRNDEHIYAFMGDFGYILVRGVADKRDAVEKIKKKTGMSKEEIEELAFATLKFKGYIIQFHPEDFGRLEGIC